MRWTSLPFIVAIACNPTRAPQPTTPPPPAADAIDVDAIVAESYLPDTLDTPLPDDPLRVTIHRLSNGLTVYLSPMPEAGRISASVVVRVGAAYDPPDAPGLTHLLEHMLEHKGTDELGTIDREAELPHLEALVELYRAARDPAADREAILGEIASHARAVAATSVPDEHVRLYRRLGFLRTRFGNNADRMRSSTELPRERLAEWAELEAERFADPVFRLLYPEIPVIFDELNRRHEDGVQRGRDAYHTVLFPEHPLGNPRLGTPESLLAPNYDAMIEQYQRWFVPNNMALVLVGDVDASLLPILDAAFSRLRPAPLPERPHGSGERHRGRKGIEIATTAGGARVELAWRTVSGGHPDAPALHVIDALLGNQSYGLLAERLALKGLVEYPRVWYRHYRDGGVVYLEGQVGDGMSHSGVEQRLLDTAKSLADGVSETDLRAAKLRLRIAAARNRETAGDRAKQIVQSFAWERQWADVVTDVARVEAITSADVAATATAYLGEDYAAVWGHTRREPETLPTPPTVGALRFADGVESSRGRAIRTAASPLSEPAFLEAGVDYSEVDAPWGSLVTALNETDDLFELRVRVERGFRDEPLICDALRAWERSGTGSQSAEQLQLALTELGAKVRTSCGGRTATIIVEGIDEHFDTTLALLREWLSTPRISDATWSQLVETEILRRAHRTSAVEPIADALRHWARYGADSIWLAAPSSAALRDAPVDAVASAVGSLGRYRRTVTYYGPRSPERVAVAAEALGPGTLPAKQSTFFNHRRRRIPEIHVVHRPATLARVDISFLAPRRPDLARPHEWIARRVVHRRARQAVQREQHVGRWGDTTVTTGDARGDARLWGMIRLRPEEVAAAVPLAVDVLSSTDVDPAAVVEELESLRAQLVLSRPTRRATPIVVVGWRDGGDTSDPDAVAWDALDQVTPLSITALLEHLTQYAPIITIVGDLRRIDLDALGEIGPVSHHERTSLFSYEAQR